MAEPEVAAMSKGFQKKKKKNRMPVKFHASHTVTHLGVTFSLLGPPICHPYQRDVFNIRPPHESELEYFLQPRPLTRILYISLSTIRNNLTNGRPRAYEILPIIWL